MPTLTTINTVILMLMIGCFMHSNYFTVYFIY